MKFDYKHFIYRAIYTSRYEQRNEQSLQVRAICSPEHEDNFRK